MLFQALDDKKNCVAVYKSGVLFKNHLQSDMTHTWATSSYLRSLPVEYAYLYCQKSLKNVCPEHLQPELNEVLGLFAAFSKSLAESKIDVDQHCFYDLVPESFLIRFCEIKNKISDYVFKHYTKPQDYNFLKNLHGIAQDIGHKKLNLDFSRIPMRDLSFASKKKLQSVRLAAPFVRYNIFGSRTGRMTTRPNSFPILNLNKEFRQAVLPNKDRFVEFDFNAFELRVLFYLLGKEQPAIDIHEWNVNNVYGGLLTRDKAKERVFAWLYNLESRDRLTEQAYSRDKILEKYWDGESVKNPFGRTIKSDKFHAISYLIQSTAADIVLRQMIKVDNLLEGRKSHIAFTIHDSVVIDMAEEDMSLLPQIKKQFSTFKDIQLLTNVSIGSDFGNMESEE